MTTTPPGEPEPDEPESPAPARLHVSATQVVASALAAILATFAASYLGVAGTVIGAAVASVLTVVGNAVFGHSLRRTGAQVRRVLPESARWVPPPADAPPAPPTATGTTWRVFAAAAVGVFVGVLLVVTAVEVIAGRPLTDLLRGKSGSGTSVFGGTTKHAAKKTPTPTPTVYVTVTPTVVVVTPTVTITGAATTATETPTVTITPSPSTSSSGTSSVTASPSTGASPTP